MLFMADLLTFAYKKILNEHSTLVTIKTLLKLFIHYTLNSSSQMHVKCQLINSERRGSGTAGNG